MLLQELHYLHNTGFHKALYFYRPVQNQNFNTTQNRMRITNCYFVSSTVMLRYAIQIDALCIMLIVESNQWMEKIKIHTLTGLSGALEELRFFCLTNICTKEVISLGMHKTQSTTRNYKRYEQLTTYRTINKAIGVIGTEQTFSG